MKPLFSHDKERCEQIAQSSITFYDEEILEKMMNSAFDYSQKDVKGLLVTSFVQRGICNMADIFGYEYLKDAEQNLLSLYVIQLKEYAQMSQTVMESTEIQELKADFLRQ